MASSTECEIYVHKAKSSNKIVPIVRITYPGYLDIGRGLADGNRLSSESEELESDDESDSIPPVENSSEVDSLS